MSAGIVSGYMRPCSGKERFSVVLFLKMRRISSAVLICPDRFQPAQCLISWCVRCEFHTGGCRATGVLKMSTSTLLLPGDRPLKIETRARWEIPNEFRMEQHPSRLKSAVELWAQLKPEARFRSISAIYNCVGMVVTHRRAWAFPEDLRKILSDDGFKRLSGPEEAFIADIVIYQADKDEVAHVGILHDRNLALDSRNPGDPWKVLSKWGAFGEYIHDMSYVPELFGKPTEFWTDRKGG